MQSHFDERSRFQHIQILETADHWRMLILDGLVNLAESDTKAYTHAIMGLPEMGNGESGEDLISKFIGQLLHKSISWIKHTQSG